MIQMHNPDTEHFLLVGNSSYQNRGCEAIVRGTLEILLQEFGHNCKAIAGVYASTQQVACQNILDIEGGPVSFPLNWPSARRWTREWWQLQINKRLGTSFACHHAPLMRYIESPCVTLEIGGDNYSLDYGIPNCYLDMDRFLIKRGIPVVLWGASVGPFESAPEFAPQMFDHLRQLSGIFVRESASFDYLTANGVTNNLHLVADPAFVMRPTKPSAEKLCPPLPENLVGLNLSPLVARNYQRLSWGQWEQTKYDLSKWTEFCVELIETTSNTLCRPILLVPHVAWDTPYNDDISFLKHLQSITKNSTKWPILALPETLTASETKWAISHCEFFIGARTHATIAALSSAIPTLSLGYSQKALGINHDIFGHLGYCINVTGINLDDYRERITNMERNSTQIRSHLLKKRPLLERDAHKAGSLLRNILTTF